MIKQYSQVIKKILIANRGEIACRIIKAAQQLNITSAVVYSESDAHTLAVQLADEAYCVGPAPSQESYLNQEAILQIAQQARVDAIHPGYGFLSENADFARRCSEQNYIFIGPNAKVIALMGDKDQAKQTMKQAGVATIPGYQGKRQTLEELSAQALQIGLPVLIKASAGGGGKGMRLVYTLTELKAALASAQREALANFGNGQLILEKYIVNARHIEAQILSDHYGKHCYLYHRDCSIQRRYQKVIEEAPAPHLGDSIQKQIMDMALAAATAIHYQNAGTIEFLYDIDQQQLYFMEMNTRLQVEHPVTEMITGIDIVMWQIRIAAGEPLTLEQADILPRGHALEARIYAEDPTHNFMPTNGQLTHVQFPTETKHVRVDTGIQAGDQVSIYYDGLLAKLIVWASTREGAVQQLQQQLANTQIVGVGTNLGLLYRITQQADFIQGHIHTQFIQTHPDLLTDTQIGTPLLPVLVAASVCVWRQQYEINQASAIKLGYRDSPWYLTDGWRMQEHGLIYLPFWHDHIQYHTYIREQLHGYTWYWQDHTDAIQFKWKQEQLQLRLNTHTYLFKPIFSSQHIILFYQGEPFHFITEYPSTTASAAIESDGHLSAPMPGIIAQVCVDVGQMVQAGDPLMIMEAMKMEHTIHAPHAGMIKDIFFQSGERVNAHEILIELANL